MSRGVGVVLGGSRRRPHYCLNPRDNRTRGEGSAATSFTRHAQRRAGECHSWLGPPSRTKCENYSERFTGRPKPTPNEGFTRSMTRSTAGTSWSGRGSRCALCPLTTPTCNLAVAATRSHLTYKLLRDRQSGQRCDQAGLCVSASSEQVKNTSRKSNPMAAPMVPLAIAPTSTAADPRSEAGNVNRSSACSRPAV